MDFGYRLCLIFGFVLVCFFSFSHQLDRLNRDEKLIAVFAQRLSQLSPTQRTTLSHALMREAFCSTVLLLLPFMHSLALAGAGTHRETRGGLAFVQGTPTPLCLYLPSTSKSGYLLGLPLEGMKGASFFGFGFTWIILALPVLSEDI